MERTNGELREREKVMRTLEGPDSHLEGYNLSLVIPNGIKFQLQPTTSRYLVWHKHFQVVSWNRYHAEHELIIYCGSGSRPGKHARWYGPKQETTIWDIPLAGDRMHATQKPVALYERAMLNSSAPAEIVVDCFAGSGSCITAAEKHNRRAYLLEIDPAYCDVMVKRWMGFTAQKAKLIAG